MSNTTKEMSAHKLIMSQLMQCHDVLVPLLKGQKIHYLDIPMYGNVGDLLIMQGTFAFFKKHGIQVAKHGMYFNYKANWATPDDVLVFQGGGNFGDIYGPFQKFREQVISARPNNRIVILPQSIHFDSEKKFAECCAIFNRHPDLHICVRDSVSEKLAKQMSSNVYLLPDMAHQLWPLSRQQAPDQTALHLRRRDGEINPATGNVDNSFDWDELIGKGWTFFLAQIAERGMYHATRAGINKPFCNLEATTWIYFANRFVQRAVSLFSKYERIDTDRLHGHILACLLSIPNRVGDNAYGKNSRYINEWTKGSDIVRLVPNEALFQPLTSSEGGTYA